MKQELTNQEQEASWKLTKNFEKTIAWENTLKLFEFFSKQWKWFAKVIKDLDGKKNEYNAYVNHWASYISDLSDEQLREGCYWVRAAGTNMYDLPPTLFRRHCFGLVDSDIAFEMAKEDEFAHPAIYFARQKIGNFNWSRLQEHEQRKRFFANYSIACDIIMRGGEIFMPDGRNMLEDKSSVINLKVVKTEKGREQAKVLTELAQQIALKKSAKWGS